MIIKYIVILRYFLFEIKCFIMDFKTLIFVFDEKLIKNVSKSPLIDDLPCTTLLTNDSAVVFLGIVVSGEAVASALQETAGENRFS